MSGFDLWEQITWKRKYLRKKEFYRVNLPNGVLQVLTHWLTDSLTDSLTHSLTGWISSEKYNHIKKLKKLKKALTCMIYQPKTSDEGRVR